MLKRSLTGVFIIAVTVGFLLLRTVDNRLFDLFLLAMALIGTFEFQRALGERTTKVQKALSFIFCTAVFVVAVFCERLLFGVIVLFLALNLADTVIEYKKVGVSAVGYNLFCCLYPTVLLLPLHYLNLPRYHYSYLILAFAVSPLSDTMAYLVGSLLKGKKLCPEISPKKTISGAIGGLIGGLIAAIAVYFVFGEKIWGVATDVLFYSAVGLICALFTELGDLVESRIKRELGIKDMGKLLPGHGGVLDRIDGLMFASAALYVIFCVIMPLV